MFVLLGISSIWLDTRYTTAIVFIPLLCVFGISWAFVIAHPSDRSWLMRLFIAALILRFCMSFIVEGVWPTFEGTSDGAAYGPAAGAIATAWHSRGFVRYGDVVAYPTGAPGYVYASAAVYWLFGYNTLLMKLINGLLAALAVVYTYNLGRHFFDQRIGRFAALCTAFMPSMLLWTTQNLKDSAVLFLSVWILWVAAQGFYAAVYRLALLGVLIALLATVRVETAIGLALIIVLTLVFQSNINLVGRLAMAVLGTLILGFTLANSGYGFLGQTLLEERLSFEAISAKRAANMLGTGAIDPASDTSSLRGFLTYLPTAIINFLLRPWPWEATKSINQRMSIPESLLLWYPLFGFAMGGVIGVLRRAWGRTSLMWVYVLAATMAAAPQYGNFGTAYRHRIQLWPIFFVFAGVGWYSWQDKRSQHAPDQQTLAHPALPE